MIWFVLRRRDWGRAVTRAVLLVLFAISLLACGRSRSLSLSPTLADPSASTVLVRQPTETTVEAALAELDAVAVPEGVDEAVFGELKDELAKALLETVGRDFSLAEDGGDESPPYKITATPPTGEINAVDDLALSEGESGDWTLSWHYRSNGDYNQDGIVNVGDILPLAIHFGQSVQDDPLNEVIDGNGDGVIGIADVTPIARSFMNEVAAYRVEAAAEIGGSYELVEAVSLPEGERAQRLELSYPIPTAEPANFYRVVPVDSAGVEGEPSNRVGLPPKIISIQPLSGEVDSPYAFSATVRGASPLTYHWVFGSDASLNFSFEPSPVVSFATTGRHTVSLVLANIWGSDAAEFTITVTRPGDWRMFGHDAQHTGRSPYAGPDQPVLAWSFQTDGEVASSAAIAQDGTIYFRSQDSYLYALDGFGQQKWRLNTEVNGYSAPAVADDGFVYVGTEDGSLLSVNPDGTLRWSLALGGAVYSSPVISADGTIYVGSADGSLHAVDPGEMEGTIAWSFATGGAIEASPALGPDGTVYVGSDDGNFYAFNPDGSLKWSYNTAGAIIGSASVGADGTVYVGSTDGNFYAFAPDGTVRWAFATGYSIESTPAIGPDGTIYFGNEFSYLFAISPDGSEKWHLDLQDSVVGAPAVDVEGTVYVALTWRGVMALSPAGVEKWLFKMDTMHFRGSPIIGDDGHIYIGNADGKLYAIGPATPRILSAGPRSGVEGRPQEFFATVTGTEPIQYRWDFGDAAEPSTSELASPTVTLGAPGTYDVTVLVGNLFGEARYRFEFTVIANLRGDWWMYGRGPKHQRRSPFAGPGTPEVAWEYFANSSLRSSPSLGADGTIYFGSTTGMVTALQPDGYRKWRLDLESAIYSTPAVGNDGTVYFGTLYNRFVAIDPDGSIKWEFTPEGSVRSSPAIAEDGTIYFGSGDGNLYALSPDGLEIWRFETELPITSSPAIGDDGTIYVGGYDGNLYAINPDGSEKWRFYAEAYVDPDLYYEWVATTIYDSPTVGVDGTIYTPIALSFRVKPPDWGGWEETSLFAISPDGSEKWRFSTGEPTLSPVAIGGDGTIYVGDTSLRALSPEGELLWTFEIPHDPDVTMYGTQAAPVIDSNGVIYLPSYYSYYDPSTFRWTFEGLLFAVYPDGTEKWHLTTRTGSTAVNSTSPAIGVDGTLYLPSEDGYLYAIGEAG